MEGVEREGASRRADEEAPVVGKRGEREVGEEVGRSCRQWSWHRRRGTRQRQWDGAGSH